jgi:hypothetical protein
VSLLHDVPFLAAKHFHVEVDVDGLAYPLHHPTVCSQPTRGWDFMSGVALSRRVVVGGGAFPGDAQAPGLDTCWSGDRLDIGGC